MKKLRFKDDIVYAKLEKYRDNSPAISLYTDDGEPYMIATVKLPDVVLKSDEVAIKDWSENRGILDVLIKAGVVSKPVRFEKTGFVTVPIVKLNRAKLI